MTAEMTDGHEIESRSWYLFSADVPRQMLNSDNRAMRRHTPLSAWHTPLTNKAFTSFQILKLHRKRCFFYFVNRFRERETEKMILHQK